MDGGGTWTETSVYSFKTDILGDGYMHKDLVLRTCYVQIRAILTGCLKEKFELETPPGLFVITGTPGIGKSVLLGYITVYLANEYDLVSRRNYTWYSRQAGPNQKILKHKEEPQMLQKSSTVLLIDPVGGQATDDVEASDTRMHDGVNFFAHEALPQRLPSVCRTCDAPVPANLVEKRT